MTDKAKATKGPWAIDPHRGNHMIAIGGCGVDILAYAEEFDSDDTPLPAEANARLIAAAPDLLEALLPVKRGAQEADYYCPDDVPDDHQVLISITVGELRAARAAIAKATGET